MVPLTSQAWCLLHSVFLVIANSGILMHVSVALPCAQYVTSRAHNELKELLFLILKSIATCVWE